ncbi:acetoin utilization protein AcuB [Beggiatoa sp. PS]|nr:acetoin utilization protein AcuB [Beggiatoa sp. PS]
MMTVKELMSRELYTLKPDDTVHEARQLMLSQQIRHIPVIDEQEQLIGLLSQRDVLAASISTLADLETQEREELESGIPINKIMTTNVVIAEEDTSLLNATQFMLSQKQGCLPVLRGKQLIGILTETDFVKLAHHLMKKMAEYETQPNTSQSNASN